MTEERCGKAAMTRDGLISCDKAEGHAGPCDWDKPQPPVTEEKRIYVVVPETIQVNNPIPGYPDNIVSIKMVPGRLMAQCAHVVSKMRWCIDREANDWEPITTIVLSVRNTRELQKTHYETMRIEGIMTFPFYDTNYDVYGTPASQFTAFCTNPVLKAEVDAALGHLELYS